MISTNQFLEMINEVSTKLDTDTFLEYADQLAEDVGLSEAQYDKIFPHIRVKVLDIEKYVQDNDLQPITNPRAFVRNSIPSDDGLLSNKIFGITMEERAGTFAYIDLHGWFLDPSCYKTWIRLDPKIRNCIHGIGFYSLDKNGYIVEDEKGQTGIDFLRKNIKNIKFRQSDSKTKKLSLEYLNHNRDIMFIQKYPVIPPYYRDKNTENSRVVGLGGINKLYTNLIIATNAVQTTQDYMFDTSDAMKGRVQESILCIYDWFAGNINPNINTDLGAGLSGKLGLTRRANMAKTADFSSRLVLSAAELKAENPSEMMCDIDHAAVPLYSVITNFRDFVMFHVKRFFENEFQGRETYPVMEEDGTVKYVEVADPEITFSDDRIKEEMDRYLHGYSNRFVPVEVPVKGSKKKYFMKFRGSGVEPGEEGKNFETMGGNINRRLTWLDIFYIAAVEATKDKKVIITRFPIDSFSNQIILKVKVSSTKETEPVYYNNIFYKNYPKIREEDIGTTKTNKFVDTLSFSNCYLKGMGGDFDGDTATVKGVYTDEANEELETFMDSKENLVTFGGAPLKFPGDDVFQATYALTRIIGEGNKTVTKNIAFA